MTKPFRPSDSVVRLDPGMHTALIRRIALSGDGSLLATASHDKSVRLWDVSLTDGTSLSLRRTLRPAIGPGDDGKINAVALAPDGTWCAAGGWFKTNADEYVAVFDTGTGEIQTLLGPLAHVIHDLEVSPDGKFLAAGLGGKGGIRVWHLIDGQWQRAYADLDVAGDVDGLAFTRDGRLYATCSDGYLRAYGPDGRRIVKVSAPGGRHALGIAASPDGLRVAVGYQNTLRVDVLNAANLALAYKVDTGGLVGGNLAVVAWRPDGGLAAAGTHGAASSPIVLWQSAGRDGPKLIPGPLNTVMDLVPHPAGALAFAGFDPSFGLVSAASPAGVMMAPPMADFRAGKFKPFLVSADGRRVRFGLGPQGTAPHIVDIGALALSPSPIAPPDLLAADISSLAIEGWQDTPRPVLGGRWRIGLKDDELAHSLAILPRREGFLLGTEWRLRRFDRFGRHVWRRPAPGPVWCVNTAADGRLVVAAYGDGTIRWHSARDGGLLLSLFVHVGWPGWPDWQDPQAKSWILWTPDGYFAGAPGCDRLIGWHVNHGMEHAAEFIHATHGAAEYHRPERVQAALDEI